ncbi:MAG: COX15/CtaA family protein [Candidatus Dormibacteria bacterium]
MKAYRNLAIVTSVCIYIQIVLGGVVRITGSGLGCRDWPLCYQHEGQRFAYRTLLEVAHRVFGSLTGLLVVACVVVAVLMYRGAGAKIPAGLLRAGAVLLGLYLFQGILGGVTVLMKNQSLTVAIHLGNSLLVLGVAVLLVTWAAAVVTAGGGPRDYATEPPTGVQRGLIFGALVAVFLIVVSGAYVVGTGASGSCPGWPLCGNPERTVLSDIHFLHRVVVLVAGLVLLRGIHLAQRRWRGTRVATAAYAAALAFVLEVAVGALQVRLGLPGPLRAAHLALATMVWAMLAVPAATLWLETRSESRADRTGSRLASAGARS